MRNVLDRPVRFVFSLFAFEYFARLEAAFALDMRLQFAPRSSHSQSRQHSRVPQHSGR